MHIYGDHVTTTKQTNVAASYTNSLKKQVNRHEDCSVSPSLELGFWPKGSYYASSWTVSQSRLLYMACSSLLQIGDFFSALLLATLALPEVQNSSLCMQVFV